MNDAMVTARMSQSKKATGAAVFESLGTTASAAINELYDYAISHKRLPFDQAPGIRAKVSRAKLTEALAYIDSIALIEGDSFERISDDQIKQARMTARGYATEDDFV